MITAAVSDYQWGRDQCQGSDGQFIIIVIFFTLCLVLREHYVTLQFPFILSPHLAPLDCLPSSYPALHPPLIPPYAVSPYTILSPHSTLPLSLILQPYYFLCSLITTLFASKLGLSERTWFVWSEGVVGGWKGWGGMRLGGCGEADGGRYDNWERWKR